MSLLLLLLLLPCMFDVRTPPINKGLESTLDQRSPALIPPFWDATLTGMGLFVFATLS